MLYGDIGARLVPETGVVSDAGSVTVASGNPLVSTGTATTTDPGSTTTGTGGTITSAESATAGDSGGVTVGGASTLTGGGSATTTDTGGVTTATATPLTAAETVVTGPVILDDFNNASLDPNYAGATARFAPSTAVVHEGTHSLQLMSSGAFTNELILRNDKTISMGDTVEYFQWNGGSNTGGFIFAADGTDPAVLDGIEVQINSGNTIYVYQWTNGTPSAVNNSTNQVQRLDAWFKVTVEWRGTPANEVYVETHAVSDGVLLGSVTADMSAGAHPSTGGFGFNAFDDTDTYMDYVRKL